ncbi:unnamed protein product [Gordionus sp. m RMFG-2023]
MSYDPGKYERKELEDFVKYLIKAYPLVHSTHWIKREVINDYSLLYHCVSIAESKGLLNSDENQDTSPWMLIAHSDVVPVSDNDSLLWKSPAFEGQIVNEAKPPNFKGTSDDKGEIPYLYGRGSLDAKHILCANLECLELMIKSGLRPKNRSLYLGFGHDEEVGGSDGASHVAKHLAKKLEKNSPSNALPSTPTSKHFSNDYQPPLAFILDEGTNIFYDILDHKNLALIGISEKVTCILKLTVKTSSGHSSVPIAGSNAIAILSSAVSKLNDYRFTFASSHSILAKRVESELFTKVSPYLLTKSKLNSKCDETSESLPCKGGCVVMAKGCELMEEAKRLIGRVFLINHDLWAPLVVRMMSQNSLMTPLFKSVSCVTKFHGGIKDNVVPSEAQAIVCQRVHPVQTISQIMEINRRVINDPRIHMEAHSEVPNIPISSFEEKSPITNYFTGYHFIKKTISQLFTDTVVAPIIMPGGTDSKHFVGLAKNIYRFSPVYMSTTDLRGVHGVNEKIAVESYEKFLNFYYRLIENVSGLEASV